jgi:D-alanyl-lipoteichoic acid acyltransferase DltB (MBOAT superfamily)
VTDLLQKLAIPVHPVTLSLMLPVGISFYTFQTLSYVIDVYKGEVEACHHFGKYATFISFFSQLVAGPIERTGNLLPQIEREHDFHADKAIAGAKLIAWGFFKKIAIADTVADYVDVVYNQVGAFSGFPLLLATMLFTFQIYCDFSGYSDIAVGVAKLLDIDLMTNFKSPYFSASIREFWSRWHISLSTWFRDYVYIPLGGNRKGTWRTRLNLLITFLCSGLWHGANWTYVLWGAIHGVGQILENEWNKLFPPRRQGRNWFRVLVTFVFVCFAWIFFRANTLADAGYVLTHLFRGISNPVNYLVTGYHSYQTAGLAQTAGVKTLILCAFCILILIFHDFIELKASIWTWLGRYRKPVRYAVYFILLFLILYSRQLGEYEFVYFQF